MLFVLMRVWLGVQVPLEDRAVEQHLLGMLSTGVLLAPEAQ
jgi:hypothetical protein